MLDIGRRLSNHFLEVQYDGDGFVYLMVHSGSRNIGLKIGDYFSKVALEMNQKWHSEGRELEIPFLPVETEEGQSYLAWLSFALDFALLNRQLMLQEAMKCISNEFPEVKITTWEIVTKTVDGILNINHNYTSLEQVYNQNLWVHRKGAVLCRNNYGIVPGSMQTKSFITKSLNNPKSIYSCSHGSGRKMSRTAFNIKMKNSHAQIEKSLEGIVHSKFQKNTRGKAKGLLDVSEIGEAYKDVESVMENQKDLVEKVVELKPMISLKG